MTSPLGHRTRYEWNPLNQLTKTIDPLNGATQLTYDPNGNSPGCAMPRTTWTCNTPPTPWTGR